MGRICVAVDKGDGDALNVQVPEFVRDAKDGVIGQPLKDPTLSVETFIDFDGTAPRNDWCIAGGQAVGGGPVASTQLEDVAETLCGHQSAAVTFSFKYGV